MPIKNLTLEDVIKLLASPDLTNEALQAIKNSLYNLNEQELKELDQLINTDLSNDAKKRTEEVQKLSSALTTQQQKDDAANADAEAAEVAAQEAQERKNKIIAQQVYLFLGGNLVPKQQNVLKRTNALNRVFQAPTHSDNTTQLFFNTDSTNKGQFSHLLGEGEGKGLAIGKNNEGAICCKFDEKITFVVASDAIEMLKATGGNKITFFNLTREEQMIAKLASFDQNVKIGFNNPPKENTLEEKLSKAVDINEFVRFLTEANSNKLTSSFTSSYVKDYAKMVQKFFPRDALPADTLTNLEKILGKSPAAEAKQEHDGEQPAQPALNL